MYNCCHVCLSSSGVFDWYLDHSQLHPLVERYARLVHRQRELDDGHATRATFDRSSFRVLDIGCGNSGLGADLFRSGWTQLTHIDISDVVIERMQREYASHDGHCGEWITMDATNMSFPAGEFDLLVEKGTVDALDCADDSGCRRLLSECARVLKPGGVLLLVTHSGPRRRLPLLMQEEYGWDVETHAVGYSNSALFVRRLRKKVRTSTGCNNERQRTSVAPLT